MKYRKKPVVIEAVQWNGSNENELRSFGGQSIGLIYPNGDVEVKTLEDGVEESKQIKHIGSLNDFIIQGVSGEFYFCKPDIFEKTYEPVLE